MALHDFGSFAPGGIQKSYSFNQFGSGRLAGSLTRVHGPDFQCESVFIKADPDNGSDIWIGGNDVDENVGFELPPGAVTGWIPISNLKLVYYVCKVAADQLQYIYIR